MARGRRRRSAPVKRREGPSHNELNRDSRESRQRMKLLDLSNESIFRYDMEDILRASSCPEERVKSLVAMIWTKASRMGIPDAKTFVHEKAEEGAFDKDAERKILRLLDQNSTYR
jgi:hypothetical protein